MVAKLVWPVAFISSLAWLATGLVKHGEHRQALWAVLATWFIFTALMFILALFVHRRARP
jgi:succinate-acetate transporter protein